MNHWVAQMFGTTPTAPTTSGQEKTAQLELFAKLAADEGIDLTTLTPQQVNELYSATFGKVAEEGETEEEAAEEHEEEETPAEEAKEEAAIAEHEEKKAQVAKLAEAELMGQVMAHSFVRELNDIEKNAFSIGDVASRAGAAAKRGGELLSGSKAREIAKAPGLVRKQVGGNLRTNRHLGVPDAISRPATEEAKKTVRKARLASEAALPGELKKVRNTRLIAGGVGGLALGTGAAVALNRLKKGGEKKGDEKEASAFDHVAAEYAIKMAEAAGYDADQAFDLVNAVYTLGLGESEKVAFIEDTSDAIHVRSLEYLEQAGYPVNWEEVFGQ